MDGRCPRCGVWVPEEVEHGTDQCIAELRDQREGLNAAVETLMRALKIALRKHNEALAREAVALDALKQAEEECDRARERWRKVRRAHSALAAKVAVLTEERDAARGERGEEVTDREVD
jgi:sugar phosphate isomerase/epimerase